jgi:precorrin-6A/cobalt-precorrin-6A reductase
MIWVIGGTADAVAICKQLQNLRLQFTLSVTTQYGKNVAESAAHDISTGALTKLQMLELVRVKGITHIIDASHPFASEVSSLAMEIALLCNLLYWRFERPMLALNNAMYFSSYHKLIEYLQPMHGNVLITTGSKYCHCFTVLGVNRLFIRVLDVAESLNQCINAGYLPHHIHTINGVMGLSDNISFMLRHQIKFVITKESGVTGGVHIKAQAAKEVGATLLVIDRPKVNYPIVFNEIDVMVGRLSRLNS